MNVDLLAPALLGFGKLIREANKQANEKRATANVLVVSDFEHKCFNINFEVILTFYEQLKTLVGDENVSSAKEILEWLFMFGGGSATTVGYFRYLKWKAGREVEKIDQDETGKVTVRVKGTNNQIEVHSHVYQLGEDPKALRATQQALSPLGSDGFDAIEVASDVGVVETLEADDIEDVVASCVNSIEEAKNHEPDVEETSAWLSVYSPVYDVSASKWRFKMGREIIYADIGETNIAKDALDRGGALVEDTYQVRLEISTPTLPDGKEGKPEYKILEVKRFIPAKPSSQDELFGDDHD